MFPLGALLATRNINTSTQVQSTEAYNSAVAMAELGIPRAEAELRLALENSTSEIDDILENAPNNPEDIIHQIGALVAGKANTQLANPLTFSDDSLSTTIEIELKETTAEQMVFEVSSIGTSDMDYEVAAEIAIAFTLSVPDDETGGGGGGDDNQQIGDFDDPWDFIDSWELDGEIRSQVEFPTLSNTHPGGTFSDENYFNSTSFSNEVIISEGSRFFVDGHMHGSGLTVNGASEFNVSETLRIPNGVSMTDVSKATIGSHVEFAGGPNLTRSTLHVGGTLISSGSSTIDDSTLWIKGSYALHAAFNVNNGSNIIVEGDMSKTNGVTIRNSTASFNGRSAFNTLNISDSKNANNPGVETKNLRVGELTLNNSHLLAKGSVRSGWGTNIGPNSELNVLGHLLTEGQITLGDNAILQVSGDLTAGGQKSIGANATLTVYGDLKFPNPYWNSLSFNGNGSRIMIYGEAINGTPALQNANIRYVETEEQCPPESQTNIICFISGDPPSGGGQGPQPGDPQVPEFDWNSDFKLQEIVYQGIKRP